MGVRHLHHITHLHHDHSLENNLWPYTLISPLQAYFLGVFTCVALFIAYNYYFPIDDSSFFIVAASTRNRRRGSKKKSVLSSPSKRRNRSLSSSPTNTNKSSSNNSPPSVASQWGLERKCARMAELPTKTKTSKGRVYKRLVSNINNRASSRVFRKNKRLSKKIGNDYAQCRGGGGGNLQSDQVAVINPIARNRAAYNNNKKNTAVWSSPPPTTEQIYNAASQELIKCMNAQPLHNDVKVSPSKSVTFKDDEEINTSYLSPASSNECMDMKGFSFDHDKENVDTQLSSSDKDETRKVSENNAGDVSDSVPNVLVPANDSPLVRMNAVSDLSPLLEDDTIQRSLAESNIDTLVEDDSTDKQTLVEGRKRLIVLISKGVHDYKQSAKQSQALNLLSDLSIPYSIVDGMDASQREERDGLFSVSGIRGNYPQIFVFTCTDVDEVSVGHTFLGGYDWLNSQTIEDLKAIVVDNVPDSQADDVVPVEEVIVSADSQAQTVSSSEARLTVLISKGVHDVSQATNQKDCLDLLTDLSIPYTIIDGMNPCEKEKRDALFEISGIRGNYPQIFTPASSDACFYLGGHKWLMKAHKTGEVNLFVV